MRNTKLLCAGLALAICIGCGSNTPQQAAAPSPSAAAAETAVPTETPVPGDETVVVETRDTPKPSLPPTPTPTPTPTPSPAPSPTPTPEPTPAPTPEPITAERLDAGEFDAYFDDALLIGDSLTDILSGYVRKQRQTDEDFLGAAKVLGTTSMSVKTASANKAYPNGISFRYRGKAVSITECIDACEAKKVFIMLGVNDIGTRSWDDVQAYYATLIDVIRENCPDTEIVLQGVLPVTSRYCGEHKLKIDRWNSFNDILAGICAEHGAAFLDFSKLFMDGNGYLDTKLSSDKQFHLNETGEAIWIRTLRLYAAMHMLPEAAADASLTENVRIVEP